MGLAVNDPWVTKASLWQAREGLGVTVVAGQIYAIGGYARNVVNGNGFLGTIEVYVPQTNKCSYPNTASCKLYGWLQDSDANPAKQVWNRGC